MKYTGIIEVKCSEQGRAESKKTLLIFYITVLQLPS